MTFRHARFRLTAWYTSVFFIVLVALGLATYIALTRSIDRQIDSAIEDTITQWVATAPDLDTLSPLNEEHGEETLDVFILAFRSDGRLVANPRGVDADDLAEHGLVLTPSHGEDWQTIRVDGERVRLRAVLLRSGDQSGGVVIGGRSLRERDDQVRTVVLVLGGVAAAGLILAGGAGYVLAGLALAPLALAYDRQRQFVADASHELRSPITVIGTAADLMLRDPELPTTTRSAVTEIREVTDEAGRLIDNLLEIARFDHRRESDPATTADLAEVATAQLDRMQPLLEAHRTEVTRTLAPAVAALTSDEAARIIRALIENVLRHTPPGTAATVTTRSEDGHVMLVVEDEGPGVPAAEHARIFERFSRLDSARTPGTGTGLGLAIVAAIASQRHGSVKAEAGESGGLRVEVRLPRPH